MRRITAVLTLTLALAGPGLAEERRVNLSDGYAMIDDGSGRIELYGSDGRQTGWGRIDGTGRRTDFFTPDGTPTGHATKSPVTDRWDLYDAGGRLMGWGRLAPDRRMEQFGLNGVRLPDGAVPIPRTNP